MKRGDLVTIALQGDYGKPRPALVVQSDLFGEHPSVTVLPVTSDLRDAPLFRVRLEAGAPNNVQKTCDIMVDKAQSVSRERVGSVFGRVTDETMLEVNRSLAIFLGVI